MLHFEPSFLNNGNAHIYFKVETSTIYHHPLLPPTLPSRKKNWPKLQSNTYFFLSWATMDI